jgi:hypothetical protein
MTESGFFVAYIKRSFFSNLSLFLKKHSRSIPPCSFMWAIVARPCRSGLILENVAGGNDQDEENMWFCSVTKSLQARSKIYILFGLRISSAIGFSHATYMCFQTRIVRLYNMIALKISLIN